MARKTFKFKITDANTISLINKTNVQLVNSFLMNFDTKSSNASVKNYKSDYNIFFCWNVTYNDNKSLLILKNQN